MKKFDVIFWISMISFFAAGIISTAVLRLTTTAQNLLQALAISIVFIIFTTRVILPKFQYKSSRITHFLEFMPLTLFVYLLVFSTGGLASPFLVLTHLFAVGMAFLISPAVSISFVFLTIFFIVINIFGDPSAQFLIAESPFAVGLYFLAYIAIVPFSYYIAKIYSQKEVWVRQLSQMLVTSKQQEENLLKNIEDPVIVLSRDLNISFVNSATKNILNFAPGDLLGKTVWGVLKFKDSLGKNIPSDKLPFGAVVATKNQTQLNRLQINTKGGDFIRINLKIMPVIDYSGEVLGLILILKEPSEKDLTLGSYYDRLVSKFADYEQGKLYWIARDLLLLSSLETGVENVSSFINISEIVENEMYSLEAEAAKKKVTITSPGLEERPMMPKEKVFMPQKRGIFKPIYVLANQNLLKVAIDYLLRTSLALAQSGSALSIQMSQTEDLVKLEMSTKSRLEEDKIQQLYNKFFNEIINMEGLKACTGLEIAIAQEIFEKHGGGLTVEKKGEHLTFSATLIRPELQKTQEEAVA